jgi:hypothetical protein
MVIDRWEGAMPQLTISEETYRRLAARAAALRVSVDELVGPALDRLAGAEGSTAEWSTPLTGDAWLAELTAWTQDARRRAGRYPEGFVLDDSREAIYREREDAQL